MTRTGKPETVSLTVDGPTRTHGLHTKPTPRAGPGKGATSRIEHMQGKKNNTEPKFTTYVYIQEHDIQILSPRIQNTLGVANNSCAQSENSTSRGSRCAWSPGYTRSGCKQLHPGQ